MVVIKGTLAQPCPTGTCTAVAQGDKLVLGLLCLEFYIKTIA